MITRVFLLTRNNPKNAGTRLSSRKKPLTKLERLRTFFSFGQKRKWIPENPASDFKAPRITLCPTLPFTHEEMLRILAAINNYKNEFPGRGSENAGRIRSLVLLLRYGGMRMGDIVSLSVNRIEKNRLLLYTQKTGVPANNILPDFVLKALDTTPMVAGDFYFWDGESKLETIIGSWRRRLNKLFELAKISNGHPHRFRDTFAVELLLTGVPMTGSSSHARARSASSCSCRERTQGA